MDKLASMLDLVNQWLRFAEAKNGVMVASTGAAVWAISQLISERNLLLLLKFYLIGLMLFSIAAFVVSLCSFMPRLNLKLKNSIDNSACQTNLLYFGDLAILSEEELIERFRAAVQIPSDAIVPIHFMYANQIIANSGIALVKFRMFILSVKLLLIGVLTPPVAVIIYLFCLKNGNANGNG